MSLLLPHESFRTYDSSKLALYANCARKFFWTYRLGLTPEHEGLDLIHGDAIHQGMQQMYLAFAKSGRYIDGVDNAIRAYILRYAKSYHEDDWFANSPKNPDGARVCFNEYPFDDAVRGDSFKLLGSEIYGEVPISKTHTLLGKLDLLIETNDGILVVDHKTSKYTLNQTMIDQHEVSFQFCTYNLLGLAYCIAKGYSKRDFKGVLVNHLTFKETTVKRATKFEDAVKEPSCEFARFYVRKTEQQLERHILETRKMIAEIEAQDKRVLALKKQPRIFTHFLPNYKACTDFYRRCEYFDLCHYSHNPLKFAQGEPQVGFKREFWDPRGNKTEEIKG